MPKKRHYPPAHLRYQLQNPPVTIHLNKKLKENLDAIKGTKSYAQLMSEILERTFNLEYEIKRLPVNEAVISYTRGFEEAEERYAQGGTCTKCGGEVLYLWNDGKCNKCHKTTTDPEFSHFRDKIPVILTTESDFEKAKVKLPNLEKLSYENGRKRGYDDGRTEGYNNGWKNAYVKAVAQERFTVPCAVCGKPMVLSGDVENWADLKKQLIECFKNWRHGNCHR